MWFDAVRLIFADKGQKNSIAVCVSGLTDRWFPEQHVINLVENNPQYSFTFFFVFQLHDHVKSNKSSITFESHSDSSPISEESFSNAMTKVSQLYSSNNSEFGRIRLIPSYNDDQFKKYLHLPDNATLDRFQQYSSTKPWLQRSHLNFYRLQKECIEDVLSHERSVRKKFDYFYIAKEDLYYFNPLNLTIPLQMLQKELNGTKSCHLITKGCLQWGGINTRVEIARREDVGIFTTRLDFYRSLYANNIKVWNPEKFELMHLKQFDQMKNGTNCALPVHIMSYTSARHAKKFPHGFCLPDNELQGLRWTDTCYPKTFRDKLKTVKCSDPPQARVVSSYLPSLLTDSFL